MARVRSTGAVLTANNVLLFCCVVVFVVVCLFVLEGELCFLVLLFDVEVELILFCFCFCFNMWRCGSWISDC